MCWHVPFVLWVHGNGLTSFVHELNALIHPFQASEWPEDVPKGLDFSMIEGLGTHTSWCEALPMDLLMSAGMFHLCYGCMSMD